MAPITSSEGAVAAVIAIAAGERVHVSVLVLLAVIVLGVVRAADASTVKVRDRWSIQLGCGHRGMPRRGLLRSRACTPRVAPPLTSSSDGSLRLPVSSACICVALPLALRGRIRITRAGTSALLLAACGEVGGFSLYSYASHRSLVVAAVLGSLVSAFAVVGAAILFGERMNRGQWFGVIMIMLGVAVLGAVRG